MGCKTKNTDICGSFTGHNIEHCSNHNPGEGTTQEVKEYPVPTFRNGNYSIPGQEANAVMYEFTEECVTTGGKGGAGNTGSTPTAANCGKVSKSLCSTFGGTCTIYNGYYPSDISFDYAVGDTWMSYLYDTSDDAGVAGTPCFHIVTCDRGSSSSSTNDSSTTTCHPCAAFNCTPQETTLRYTASEDLTGDVDCPHPTLFGFGTSSNKLAFEYTQLSSELPDGVVDFELSYNGATYTDAWNNDIEFGITYESTQNPWQIGDEGFEDFQIYDIDLSATQIGFRVKVRIAPIFDDTTTPITFSGTRWTVEEILDPGTGFSVGDVASLTYDYVHPDASTTQLQIDLRVSTVGQVPVVNSQSGFDVLRIGDTVNGHTILRTFHTDIDNFPYHVIYLDGNGSDFTKDTQYTSNRAHTIRAKAGKGIVDRGILVGRYEFLDKSVQFVTASLNRNAVDTYSGSIVQPDVNVTVTNGRVTGTSIVNGGQGWNTIGKPPKIAITGPPNKSGKEAKVKGTFSNGVLTAVEIESPGSGYDDNYSPKIYVRNIKLETTEKIKNEGYDENATGRYKSNLQSFPKDEESSVSSAEFKAVDDVYSKVNQESETTSRIPEVDIKKDLRRRRIKDMPQRLFSEQALEPAYEATEHQHNLNYISDTPISKEFKAKIITEKERDSEQRKKDIQDITQTQIPEVSNYPESFIETVQGSLEQLPEGSAFTKYIIRQYRPDSTQSNSINISLSCTPVDSGCLHFTCAPPGVPSPVTETFDEDDPNTAPTPGNPNPTTPVSYTTTCTVSPLLGTGCQQWTVSGNMTIFNDLTRTAESVSQAAAAYGNPF